MFVIPNLGLNIQNGFLLSIGISFVLTLITFLVKNPLKKRENSLSCIEIFELYLNRLIHWFSNIIILLFPYIFNPNLLLYIIYDLYILVVIYTWYLIFQCPITIHENRILFKDKSKYTVYYSKKLQVYIALLMSQNIFNIIFRSMVTLNVSLVTFSLAQYYYYYYSKK
jgi:hypothetical protein